MNKDQVQAQMGLLILKGLIAEAEEKDRDAINEAAGELRAVLAKHGDNGTVALSLVQCELAAGGLDK